MIEQWGKGTRNSGVNYGDVTLPVQFNQTNYLVVGTIEKNDANNNSITIYKTDNQHFRFYLNDYLPIMYTATGY